MKTLRLIVLLLLVLALPAQAGQWTGNGYFYKPSMGASGPTEWAKFNQGLDQADAKLASIQSQITPTAPLTYDPTSGVLAITGETFPVSGLIAGTTDIQTFTNKRITKRVQTFTADSTSITPNGDSYDAGRLLMPAATAGTLTVNNPSGTPTDFQKYELALTTTNAQTISWGNAYVAGATPLPAVTVSGQEVRCGFDYDFVKSTWKLVAVAGGFAQ